MNRMGQDEVLNKDHDEDGKKRGEMFMAIIDGKAETVKECI